MLGADTAPRTDLLQQSGATGGTGVSGRGAAARGALVKQRGGNDASERAVALGLAWLAEHQLPDGGWSFDHRLGACQGRCGQPGAATEARRAATAMALLPFLGAGQTHRDGSLGSWTSRGRHVADAQLVRDFLPDLGSHRGVLDVDLVQREPASLEPLVVTGHAVLVDERAWRWRRTSIRSRSGASTGRW